MNFYPLDEDSLSIIYVEYVEFITLLALAT